MNIEEKDLKQMIQELTSISEKSHKLKIDYLKDAQSTLLWSLIIPGIVLVAIFSNTVLIKCFTEGNLAIALPVILAIQAIFAFLHRVYNGTYIDMLIFLTVQLDLQKVYLSNNLKLVAVDNILELSHKIHGLEFLYEADTITFEKVDRQLRISKGVTTFFSALTILSMVSFFAVLIYNLMSC